MAIVPAAGLGKRFGAGKKKAFQMLGGRPVIIRPLEVLQSIAEIAEIIPVLKVEDMEQGQELFDSYGLTKIKRIAAGGKERQDSVYSGLKLVDDDDCIVIVHDGVRPLIEKELVEKAIEELTASEEHVDKAVDGIVLGVPVKDTVKEIEGGVIKRTLKRDDLWAVQTPQVFLYKKIRAAYDQAARENFYSTDDSALLERYGGRIKVAMGSYKNIKVTTPEDLDIAELFLNP